MSNELIQIKEVKLVPFFTKGDSVDTILKDIAKEARAHVPDVSTTKSRGEITKNITKVTDCKTYLEAEGKALAAEYKLIPKAIDGNRKKVKDFLTDLQSELRQPLTNWDEEKKQAKDIVLFLVQFDIDLDAAYLEKENRDLKSAQEEADRKAEIERATIKAAAEAKAKAEQAAADQIAKVEQEKQDAINRELKAERDAEAARQLAEQSERDRIAAEEARKEEIRVDYHKRMIQHIVDCGNGFIGGAPQPFGVLFRELETKIIIDESFEEFRQEAETAKNQAIQKLNDCQEKQARDREEAELQAKRDTEAAAEGARQTELKRQQDLADQKRRDQAQREANRRHCGNINRTAMEAFIHSGLSEEQAKEVVVAIAKGLIPNVTINY